MVRNGFNSLLQTRVRSRRLVARACYNSGTNAKPKTVPNQCAALSNKFLCAHSETTKRGKMMFEPWLIAPLSAIVSVLAGLYFYRYVDKQDSGTEKMKEISGAIKQGAAA